MVPALLTLALMGFVAALGLAIASRVFYVEIDPRVEAITELLPGANCGACGYAGCSGLAAAIVKGEGKIENCTAIDKQAALAIADIMGIVYTETEKRKAVVHCNYVAGGVAQKFLYLGVTDCRAADLIGGGPKMCPYACIGLGTCAEVCPFDAIHMTDEGLPIVDPEKCTACGKCVEACPKGIIDIAPQKPGVHVLCSSRDKGGAVKKICTVGCIACLACERICPFEAIEVKNNIAVINYDKCRVCGLCVSQCPTATIIDERKYSLVAKISDECNGCTLCSRVCPVDAISGEPKGKYKVDSKKCIGCRLCADQCKRGAITFERVKRVKKKAKVASAK